jgi:glycosyltransferase involved in cell wall biosynthesis
MKVLQIIPMFKLAGAETMCENLCKALRNQGCDVVAVSLYTEHTPITDRLENAGIKVVYLGKKKGFDFSTFVKLYQLMKKERPEVVHTHIYAARYALPVAAFCGIPKKIHTVHNIAQQEQAKAGKIVNKFMFKHCGVVPVALSEEVKKTVEEVYELPAEQIPVIFNGVDLSNCKVKEDYTKKDEFKIVHIGRFMDVKNHAMILKTFAMFSKRHMDAKLQLIGEGELRKDMVHLAQELGVENSVEFVGLQSNVYPWLHNADIFILPSKFEGMPMTLLEAMGTGLPIIASAVGGVPDMLTDGESAMLIKPESEQLLASLEMLYHDESIRRVLGQKALQRSFAFSSETMAQRYIEIYR